MEESVRNAEGEEKDDSFVPEVPENETLENETLETETLETGFVEYCKKALHLPDVDAASYSPLVLAYIGDAVYELMIRTRVVSHGSIQVNKMHKKSASLVKAETQAALINLLEPELTPQEMAVFKRGRNAKSVTVAKHATMIDYRRATGFEALVGYLFLTEQFGRMVELVSIGLEKIGEFETE